MTFEPWPDLGERLHGADDVRAVVDDDRLRVGLDVTRDLVRIDTPLGAAGDEHALHAVIPRQVVERPDHGVVLDDRGDHVIAFAHETQDQNVEGLGRVAGETEAVGARAAEEAGQLVTRVLDQVTAHEAEIEAGPPGVDPAELVDVDHPVQDLGGFGIDRGRVVQVDDVFDAFGNLEHGWLKYRAWRGGSKEHAGVSGNSLRRARKSELFRRIPCILFGAC
jgi:hypothetical protein